MEASILYSSQCILGEGPLWHSGKKKCFWVDIEQGILFEYDWLTKKTQTWQFDYNITLVLESTGNHLLLALNTGIARFMIDSGKLEWLTDVEEGVIINRCNDGACDCRGRLWVGTMHRQHEQEAGSLYCIDNDLVVNKKLANVTISNGIAWSLNNKRLYYIDSPTQKIQSFLLECHI